MPATAFARSAGRRLRRTRPPRRARSEHFPDRLSLVVLRVAIPSFGRSGKWSLLARREATHTSADYGEGERPVTAFVHAASPRPRQTRRLWRARSEHFPDRLGVAVPRAAIPSFGRSGKWSLLARREDNDTYGRRCRGRMACYSICTLSKSSPTADTTATTRMFGALSGSSQRGGSPRGDPIVWAIQKVLATAIARPSP